MKLDPLVERDLKKIAAGQSSVGPADAATARVLLDLCKAVIALEVRTKLGTSKPSRREEAP